MIADYEVSKNAFQDYITDHSKSNGHMLLKNYIEAGDQDDNYTKLTDVIQVPDYTKNPFIHGD